MRGLKRSIFALVAATACVVGLSAGAAVAKGGGGGGGGGGSSPSLVEFSQCANDAPPSTSDACPGGWINGILNGSNSHYSEDEVVPQRLALSLPDNKVYKLQLRYLDRKGSANAHAYDSLATWNVTQTSADPCQSLASGVPCTGTPSTLPMASDSTNVPPVGPGISPSTAAHELPAASRQWTLYGGTLDSTTAPTHTAASQTGTDDYAVVTVSFHVSSASGGNVLLLFGGHLAVSGNATVPRAWGPGLGASHINGGPYHIITDNISTTINGKPVTTSLGNHDNQIQAGAILPGSPEFTITKTATPEGTLAPGSLVDYKITVTNTGTAAGTATFTDNFDDRLNPTDPTSDPSGGTCQREAAGSTDKFFTCTTSTLLPGGGTGSSQTFSYTAQMPSSFSGSNGSCNTGFFPVPNTATLTTGGSATVTVCVPASPKFTLTKTVDKTTANPGDVLHYALLVTNNGTSDGSTTVTDDYDSRLAPLTSVPTGCTDGAATTPPGPSTLTCTTGDLAAGASQEFDYTATVPTTITGDVGTGCGTGQFAFKNTATVVNGTGDSKTVCVNATPSFTVTKTASTATAGPGTSITVAPGDSVTYTITVTNGGATAGSTTFDDHFDPRLSPTTTPSGCVVQTDGSGNKYFHCTTNSLAAHGGSQTFSYTVSMPNLFTGQPNPDKCNGQPDYAVINTVTLANNASAGTTVCVTAAPNLSVTKTANPTTAHPGDQVTYTITVKNTGSAPGSTTFTDDYDDRLSPSAVTITPSTGGAMCTNITTGNHEFSCTTSSIPAGTAANPGVQTFSYTANMPTTFTGSPGGLGCSADSPHQYPVHNVVVLGNGASDDSTVCVNAAPNLSLHKSATASTDANGNQLLTYTIDYANTGPAEATLIGISDAIPDGTTYVSCTANCIPNNSPVTSVAWSIGPVGPNGSATSTGSVTFTVQVTTTQLCTITNTASVQFRQDTAVLSNTVNVNVTPLPNPAGAHANGSAIGAQVVASGLVKINTSPISTASTSQSGVGGPQLANQSVASISIPNNGSVLAASVLTTTSSSTVTAAPDEADQTSTATTAHICVVPVAGLCTVEADAVRGVASTTATGSNAFYSSAGSTITNLKVVGLATPVDLNQTTIVNLSSLVFGAGSYVAINERTGSAGLTSGTYHADLTVTMIHVKITGVLGLQSAEVIVGRAVAHSDFPQTTVCNAATTQSVSGHAYVAGAFTNPVLVNAVQGLVGISPLGGTSSQHIDAVHLPADSSLVGAATGDSSSTGTLTATQSSAVSAAQVAGDDSVVPPAPACVLRTGTTCVVTADVIHSEAHSTANSSGSTSSDSGTSLVNVKVLGIPVAATPAPNTVIELPGIGFLVLNEQVCDGGGLATHTCTGATHSGITIRSVDLVVTVLNNILKLLPGVEVVVAEAHADSRFGA